MESRGLRIVSAEDLGCDPMDVGSSVLEPCQESVDGFVPLGLFTCTSGHLQCEFLEVW